MEFLPAFDLVLRRSPEVAKSIGSGICRLDRDSSPSRLGNGDEMDELVLSERSGSVVGRRAEGAAAAADASV